MSPSKSDLMFNQMGTNWRNSSIVMFLIPILLWISSDNFKLIEFPITLVVSFMMAMWGGIVIGWMLPTTKWNGEPLNVWEPLESMLELLYKFVMDMIGYPV